MHLSLHKTAFRRLRSDEGFTLTEALVAMVVAVLLFIGFTQAIGAALRNQHEVRLQQQATGLAIEGVEYGHVLEWDTLAMTAYPIGDPLVSGTTFKGAAIGLASDEELVVDAAQGLLPDPVVETLDGQDFTVKTYATKADTGLRRLIIVVEWTSGAVDHREYATSLVSMVTSDVVTP